jgi:hypothetical protein
MHQVGFLAEDSEPDEPLVPPFANSFKVVLQLYNSLGVRVACMRRIFFNGGNFYHSAHDIGPLVGIVVGTPILVDVEIWVKPFLRNHSTFYIGSVRRLCRNRINHESLYCQTTGRRHHHHLSHQLVALLYEEAPAASRENDWAEILKRNRR